MSGLRALRGLVAAWKPGGPASSSDAAGAVAAAWPDIVGAAVAARTRPARLRDGLLTVWTAGSAWSHQLSFLEPAILEGLRAKVPEAGVKRLRFAVASGRTRRLLDGAAARTSPAIRTAAGNARGVDDTARAREFDDAADPAAIVRRLRARQADLDARRARDGWTRCGECANWMPPDASQGASCVRCAEEARIRSDGALERALCDAPWLSARDICAAVEGAGRPAFERVRRRLLSRLEIQLDNAARRLKRGALEAADRVAAWTYLMLLARKQRRDLPRPVIADILGEAWADALGVRRAIAPARGARRTAGER
ncbi:MAG TPA: DUF721 domain-containing protein [Candidatus Eremiobacteraceae bacterium]